MRRKPGDSVGRWLLPNLDGTVFDSDCLRNTRFMLSFFRFAAYEMPTHSAQIQRVLAMPAKRFERKLIDFLTRPEVDALLAAHGCAALGGTELFRLVAHPRAGAIADALAADGIHVRRFPERREWLRFGLPGLPAAWWRLAASLQRATASRD